MSPNQAVLSVQREEWVRAPLAPLCCFGVLSWASPRALSHQLQVGVSEIPQLEGLPNLPILQAQADGPGVLKQRCTPGLHPAGRRGREGILAGEARALLPQGGPISGVLPSYKTGQ